MSKFEDSQVKSLHEVALSETENVKTTYRKNGEGIILVPQPSNDSDDPLVSAVGP